jgi:hypothetical protein
MSSLPLERKLCKGFLFVGGIIIIVHQIYLLLINFMDFLKWILARELLVTVAVRSEAWVLAGCLLGSWVRIPLRAWMFIPCLSVLCCPV